MLSKVIMLVDFDYFFAQIEENRNPSLKDKPVVVCVYSGRTTDSGAVSTANYIARKYGVKSGMPIIMAKRKLKDMDAAFLPVDHKFYRKVSEKIMTLLRNYAELFEQAGIDEAYLDVSKKSNGNFEKAKILAQKIKKAINDQEKITCSIGIGPNKLIAKIAADSNKPDGLTVVKPEEIESFLSPLPVNRLLGIGSKTKKKMQKLGINLISDLAKYDIEKLITTFGKNLGIYYHNASQGIDNEPVQERSAPESISKMSTLKENTQDFNILLKEIYPLCNEIHIILIQRKLNFKSVGIIGVMTDMSILSRSKTLETPTNNLDLLKRIVKELLERLLLESNLKARRIGVKISNFVKEEQKQKKITSFVKGNRKRSTSS